MAKIIYQPTAADHDETVVAGITFKAYAETEVPDQHGELVAKLKRNPWFTEGEIDADRHAAWEKVRAAHQKAKEHREEADRLEREGL
jgi:hypothetical protein